MNTHTTQLPTYTYEHTQTHKAHKHTQLPTYTHTQMSTQTHTNYTNANKYARSIAHAHTRTDANAHRHTYAHRRSRAHTHTRQNRATRQDLKRCVFVVLQLFLFVIRYSRIRLFVMSSCCCRSTSRPFASGTKGRVRAPCARRGRCSLVIKMNSQKGIGKLSLS